MLCLVASFLLVSAGQIDWSIVACLLTSLGGYALCWWGLDGLSNKRKFLFATFWMMGVQCLQQGWLTSTAYIGPFGLVGWMIHPFSYGLAFGWVSVYVQKKIKWSDCIAIAALWTLLEWGRPWLFLGIGFAWNPVGLVLTATLPSLHFVSIGGMLSLTFWVMLSNLCFYRWKWRGAWIATIPFIIGGGLLFLHQRERETGGELTALLVQQAKSPQLSESDQWKQLCGLLEAPLAKKYDFIILSEGAVPHAAQVPYIPSFAAKQLLTNYWGMTWPTMGDEEHLTNLEMLSAFAEIAQTSIVVGMSDDQRDKGYFNGAFHIQPDQAVQIYHKRRLLPFGECLPFFFRWSRPFLPIDPGFAKGNRPVVLSGKVPFGISICYEETLGELNRASRKAGAQVLMGLTNDVWYPKSRLPITHFHHARVRTVELGMPMLRACNTGVTCAIDSLGRLLAQLPHETRQRVGSADVLEVTLPPHHYSTLYLLWGDLPIFTLCIFYVGWFFWQRVRSKESKEICLNEMSI